MIEEIILNLNKIEYYYQLSIINFNIINLKQVLESKIKKKISFLEEKNIIKVNNILLMGVCISIRNLIIHGPGLIAMNDFLLKVIYCYRDSISELIISKEMSLKEKSNILEEINSIINDSLVESNLDDEKIRDLLLMNDILESLKDFFGYELFWDKNSLETVDIIKSNLIKLIMKSITLISNTTHYTFANNFIKNFTFL